jgi:hypothetical protein
MKIAEVMSFVVEVGERPGFGTALQWQPCCSDRGGRVKCACFFRFLHAVQNNVRFPVAFRTKATQRYTAQPTFLPRMFRDQVTIVSPSVVVAIGEEMYFVRRPGCFLVDSFVASKVRVESNSSQRAKIIGTPVDPLEGP